MNSDMRARAGRPDVDWSEAGRRAVDLIRVLAMDSVGHLGASVGCTKSYAEFGITAERPAGGARQLRCGDRGCRTQKTTAHEGQERLT